jgi:hypothetical protein
MNHLSWVLFSCVVGVAAAGVAGCGSDPADVAGTYTISLTNRENGCMFANWVVGEQTTGVRVTITQSGDSASASVEGTAGAFFDLWLGGHVYTGTVDGDELSLELFGNRPQTLGNCAFTYNSRITATIHGDALSGRVEYTAKTNNNPDCAALESCITYQDFNGTRPPQ